MERARIDWPQWLAPLLSDTRVTDICLNGPSEVFADFGSGMTAVNIEPSWTDEELRNWVLRCLSHVGKSWDAKHPFVDTILPGGIRMHAIFPPASRLGIVVSLRKLHFADVTNASAASPWSVDPHYAILRQAITRGESMIIAGATGSGKTTLANQLLGEVNSSERIIALEDTPELHPTHPHFLSLNARPANSDGYGEITLNDLLRQCLRMRPDRIILGECRGNEVLELLLALNTGHKGALATLHANSARDALRRIELLCLIAAKGTLTTPIIRELLSTGIEWVVFIERQRDRRVISEISRIEGKEGETILLRPVVNLLQNASGLSPHSVRGLRVS